MVEEERNKIRKSDKQKKKEAKQNRCEVPIHGYGNKTIVWNKTFYYRYVHAVLYKEETVKI